MFQPRTGCAAIIVLPALLQALPTGAEVMDADATGFTTRHSVTISRPRAEVYSAAVRQVGSWWSDDHTVSGQASNLHIEPTPQGCFCEKLGERGGVVHMIVTFVNPTVMLRLSGGLGPLGLMGVSGNMTWEFEDDGGATAVTWSYAVGGYLPDGLDRIADAVDAVLAEQLQLLKEFAESGA
jgi:uncharacterized protein YndB with AHSA1/START domain